MIVTPFSKFIPLRESPDTPDERDSDRLTFVQNVWSGQDDLVRQYNRQVEENIRMLAGQQYTVFHPVLGKFMDITDWMSEDERRWRQRPVFNRLIGWYIITHARATENPPIVTFVPGPDAIDAELAEVMDISQKSLWFECNMDDIHDRLMSWVIVGGRGHLQTLIDPFGGPLKKWIGDDLIPVVDEYDQPILQRDTQEPVYQLGRGLPFDAKGTPLAQYRMYSDGSGEVVHLGEPHAEREGQLSVEVLSPLQVRMQWGPQPPYAKKWHAKRAFLTPEEVWERYGVEVQPDVRGGLISDQGELERIAFGTGFYGAVNDMIRLTDSSSNADGYVEITELTQAPSRFPGMEQTETSPGGRHLVVTKREVLSDGPRPAAWPYTSSIRTFEFIRLPGRPGGTTPQESMNPVQRAYNDGYARIKEHVNLCTNPKGLIDLASGIKSKQFTNAPGDNYVVNRRPGVPAIEYVAPPPLGQDVYRLQEMLLRELTDMGNQHGTSGEVPTPDPSGELIKELRFNSDRFLGPTMKRSVMEYGRLAEDWQAALPIIWDDRKAISYAGEDNIARTMVVLPMMFQRGKINVRADVESMLPEGRGEKQSKVYKMWLDGAFGPPNSPQALQKFYELMHMPHLSRVAKPGGIDRTTAEQENGQLLLGVDPSTLPVYEWYDDDIHLTVLESFMKSPEFKKQSVKIKDAFVFHRQAHLMNRANKVMALMQQQAAIAGGGGPEGAAGRGAASKTGAPDGEPNNSAVPEPPPNESLGGVMPTGVPQSAAV